ncbi:MAG TPA: peptidoglycan DD-metalloendopeptidase family protein, partial [Acetobacteraceae bacterium]|nr:peptidoglycan DD-metalloendopeptidase family protein [Acetobacteraceae bacterium]
EAARVAGMSADIAGQSDALKVAEAGQAAEAAALDREIAAAGQSEAQARGTEAAAAAAAARAAAQATTLHGVLASIEVAARRARQAAAQQAEKTRKREQVALMRPPPSPPVAAQAQGAVGGAPVAGVLVSAYGAPTPAGPATGIRYQTAPGAHVLAPCGGTVEFAAPFRSYGELVIVDCGSDYRFVLAGMQTLLVSAGSTVAAGEAVGVMAEWNPDSQDKRPTLYLELHHGGEAVNPLPWLHARG